MHTCDITLQLCAFSCTSRYSSLRVKWRYVLVLTTKAAWHKWRMEEWRTVLVDNTPASGCTVTFPRPHLPSFPLSHSFPLLPLFHLSHFRQQLSSIQPPLVLFTSATPPYPSSPTGNYGIPLHGRAVLVQPLACVTSSHADVAP